MITSKLKNDNKINSKYPFIGEYNKDGNTFLVFFIKEKEGVVIAGTDNTYKIGHYSNSWLMGYFEPYKGTVELKNS